MATPQELISLFGDDFDEVLKGLNALPPEVKKLLDDTLGKLVYDAEVFGQRINKAVQTRGARGISLSNISGSLATDMQNKGRIFGELKNSIKESLVEGVNQSGQAGTFQAYDPDEKTIFTWITVAGHKICGDCSPRGGQKATLAEWEEQGMPATGWSVCGGYCYCILDPSGKLSPRIEFQEVQEKGATIRPKPTPPAAPLPKPPITRDITNKSNQQVLEDYVYDIDDPNRTRGFGSLMARRHGTVNFQGLSDKNFNSIARAVEDTLGKFEGVKVHHFGFFKRGMQARNANAAAWYGNNNYILGIKKSYAKSPKAAEKRGQLNFKLKKARDITQTENTLKTLKERKASGQFYSGDDVIEKYEKKLKMLKDKRYNKWTISTASDDALYTTTKHESWHLVDFQVNKIKNGQNAPMLTQGGSRSMFGKQLEKFNVTRDEWHFVSEYAGSDIAELWAETGTALDLGLYVPPNIKKAFISTLKEVGYSYQ